jgi:hypothetical protein
MLKMPTLKEMNRHYARFFPCGGLLQQPAKRGTSEGARKGARLALP